MADPGPRAALVIPTFNGAGLTKACVEAVLASPPERCTQSVIVVDDGSSDRPELVLAPLRSQIELVRLPENKGFATACNAGAEAAGECDFLVFLNNDTIPTPGWLDALVDEALASPDVGAVGAKLLFPDGTVQHAGVAIGQDGLPHHIYAGFPSDHPAVNHRRTLVAATAACLLVRRGEFEALSGFDAAFHNGYEDIDLCLRLGARGRQIVYRPDSVLYHLESVTRAPTGVHENIEPSSRLYDERWRETVARDDLERYLEDGVLGVGYGSHYPITLSIAPELAVVRSAEEELSGLERLLAERSQQVIDLLGAQTRRLLADAATVADGARATESGTVLSVGREHTLGGGGPLISLLLPVKNAGPRLRPLLSAVLGQSISARVEIVAVDSGSSDGTVAVLKEFGATVVTIPASAFNHGLTRNLAVSHARGELVVFLSQNALPVDTRWLAPLIAPFRADPEIVGVCSRVIPHPGADPLTTKDGHDDRSASPIRRRIQIEDWPTYAGLNAAARRDFLAFHSVSAAIKAEAVRTTPFREMRTIGEDVLWARQMLEAGWALLHEPASVLYHSHDYGLAELFGRNLDDGVAECEISRRTMDSDEIVPLIERIVATDWHYLREQLGLRGAELEEWQLRAVLRRVAQVTGRWMGVNHEALPEGAAAHFSGVHRSRTPAAGDGARTGQA